MKILIWSLFTCFLTIHSEWIWAQEDLPPDAQQEPSSEEVPSRWGVGVGFGWINDYPGSEQGRARYIVAPSYRGKNFTVDRQEGVKGSLINDSRFKLSLSFTFMFPTDSDDIPLRQGMPDLDWTLQLGPELQVYLIRTPNHTMFLRLPLRFAATTDFSHRFDYRDWNFAPSLRNNFKLGEGLGEISTRLELDYSSESLNDVFYEVAPAFATPERPAFDAKEGIMETIVGVTFTYTDFKPWMIFVGTNAYFMGDAKNTESPLLVKNRNYSYFMGLIRYF